MRGLYMLVTFVKYKGQRAINLGDPDNFKSEEIYDWTDQKKIYGQKQVKVKKTTLPTIDMITSTRKSIYDLSEEITPYENYDQMFIGNIYNGYFYRNRCIFDDEKIFHIASSTIDGKLNSNDKISNEERKSIEELIFADHNFITYICYHQENDLRLSKDNLMMIKKANNYASLINNGNPEDYNEICLEFDHYKKQVVESLYNYKTFRSFYILKNEYLKEKIKKK